MQAPGLLGNQDLDRLAGQIGASVIAQLLGLGGHPRDPALVIDADHGAGGCFERIGECPVPGLLHATSSRGLPVVT